MRSIYFLTALVTFLVSSFSAPALQTQRESGTIVIEGGTLIDGNGGQPVEDALIVIRGNRIQTVSRQGQASPPAGAQVIRADGKFILPGLMDAHCHYAEWMPELQLAHGVTSIFSIGSGGEWALAQRKAIERGKIPGPRTFLAVGSIAGAQISAVSDRSGTEGSLSGRQVANSAAAGVALARRFIEAGADMIKVHRGPPVEVYRAAIEEAHKAGLPVVAQPLGQTVYAREAVLAGADILEHAAGVSYSIARDPSKWKGWGNIEQHSIDPTPYSDMDAGKARELIQLMVERNVYLEPDFIAMGRGFQKQRQKFELQDYRLLSQNELSYIPERNRLRILRTYREYDNLEPAEWEQRNQGYQNMARFMRQFSEAGGKLMAGTDAAGWAVPGIGLHHELEILVEEVGLTPMEAIVAATRNIAEGFRILDRLGTIEAGKLADLVILNADPLQDIRNTLDIEWVLKDGKIQDRTYHAWFENPLPRGGVDAPAWVRALKSQTIQRDRFWAFGQPSPGIEAVSPTLITQGSPTLELTIQGVNFTAQSLVSFGGHAVPAKLVSESELRVTIGADLIEHVGTYPITVTNPEPLQRPEWGGTSNKAHLLVDFRY